jgi:hypothetical protein
VLSEEPGLVDAVGSLLESVSGLETLFVSTPGVQRVNTEKVVRHGQTLRHLHLDSLNNWGDVEGTHTGDDQHTIPIAELQTLVNGCPLLEELGIHVAFIHFSDWQHGTPFSVPKQATLANALDILSQLRALRNLRFTHSLAHEEDTDQLDQDDLERYACRHNHVARSVMQYLDDKGCSVEVMAFSPLDYEDQVPPDYNGHRWPNYYYVRGTATVRYRGRERNTVQAIPVALKDVESFVRKPQMLTESWQ